MTDDDYKDLEARIARLEANSYSVTFERRQKRENAARLVYRSWLAEGDHKA